MQLYIKFYKLGNVLKCNRYENQTDNIKISNKNWNQLGFFSACDNLVYLLINNLSQITIKMSNVDFII